MSKDYLVKALAFDGAVRIYAARTTTLVHDIASRHGAFLTAAAALGRMLTATCMMGGMLKGEDTVTVRIDGGGPIGQMVAYGNASGEVRGYVSNPRVHFQYDSGKLNVGMAVGVAGELYVTKDLGLKDYFTGQVPLQTGEIGDDFTYYFAQSEQTPSAVGLGVLVNPDNAVVASGGFILQMMPGATEEVLVQIEENLGKIKPVSEMVADGMSPEAIIDALVGDGNAKILETVDLTFKCTCSREKFEGGLVALGTDELDSMIKEDNGAEAVCHFCMEKYVFSAEDLEGLKNV